jgi:2',3'-cyclic-nucleotide 2'-phosphodiesterase (5'-nucleotidase family)
LVRTVAFLVAALAVAAAAACAGDEVSPAGEGVVTLFHETHTHGKLAGTPERGHDVHFADYVGLRNALRAELADSDASLFLGNGDDLSAELNGVLTWGRHVIDAFNAADLDADTYGFSELHELGGFSPESLGRLRDLVADSDFAWVSANVREGRNGDEVFAAEQGARLWIVEEVGGVRVGITGLVSDRSGGFPAVPSALESHIQVLDPVEAMREVLPRMQEDGADIVVVLSHMSHEDTLSVVRSVEWIDVALGTHVGPPTLQPQEVGGAIVAVAGPDEMQALGRLELTIRDGDIASYTFERHVPSESVAPDEEVEEALAEYLDR